jgi:hypothetical protein
VVIVSVVGWFIVSIVLGAVYLSTCFGISQAPGTSVSRGVRRNALVKASERHEKERLYLFGVKANCEVGQKAVETARAAQEKQNRIVTCS